MIDGGVLCEGRKSLFLVAQSITLIRDVLSWAYDRTCHAGDPVQVIHKSCELSSSFCLYIRKCLAKVVRVAGLTRRG